MFDLEKLEEKRKNIHVFIGEAGSGKSEIAINLAVKMAGEGKKVSLYDVDQTKPVFRSREIESMLNDLGVEMKYEKAVLDAPVMPQGMKSALEKGEGSFVIDVGGEVNGARMIGQFSQIWGERSRIYYVTNRYRTMDGNEQDLVCKLNMIKEAARVEEVTIVSNSNFGEITEMEDVVRGHESTRVMLQSSGLQPELIVALDKYKDELRRVFPGERIFGIRRYLKGSWE